MDYSALKSELTTDPNGYGLTVLYDSGQDQACVDMLNTVRDTIEIDRGVIPSYEIFEALVPAEWVALSTVEKERIALILGMAEVDTSGVNTKAVFLGAFGAGTDTRTALIALTKRKGSRAEQLFGQSVVRKDIREARVA